MQYGINRDRRAGGRREKAPLPNTWQKSLAISTWIPARYTVPSAYMLMKKGKNTASEQEVVPLLEEIEVKLAFVQGEQRVFLGERDVSQAIRQPEISMAASNVSAIPKVREFLFDLQRDIAKQNNVVMDGRDIGTVVLPDAQVKIF